MQLLLLPSHFYSACYSNILYKDISLELCLRIRPFFIAFCTPTTLLRHMCRSSHYPHLSQPREVVTSLYSAILKQHLEYYIQFGDRNTQTGEFDGGPPTWSHKERLKDLFLSRRRKGSRDLMTVSYH